MKKIFLFILFAPSLLLAQTWKAIPAAPRPGETVRVEFDLATSKLRNVENVGINGLEWSKDKPNALEIATVRSENKLIGIFTLGAETKSLVLMLENDDNPEQTDNNGGEGFFIPVCDATGKQLPESMAAQAILYRDFGFIHGLNKTASKAYDLQTRAFVLQADLKLKYWSNYINYVGAIKKKDEANTEAIALLELVENSTSATELDLLNVARYYERLGLAEKLKSTRDKIRSTWPTGTLVKQENRKAIEMEPDLAKGEAMLASYALKYPALSNDEKMVVDQLRGALANKYGDQQNWDKFRSIAAQMSDPQRASLYNNFAWELAEKGLALDEASIMAATATQIARREITQPTEIKTSYLSNRDWAAQRKQSFAMYADTYAFILDKKGDSKGAADLQAEVIAIVKGADLEMNERYTAYLERSSSPELRYQLEGFLLKGKATPKMLEQFKRLYMAEERNEAAANAYISKLEGVAKVEKTKALLQKMTNDPAPGFSLKNLKGETVSLEGLRGKVVVVDFWATWCGPCKSSFPGMQKAVDHYKNDPNVAFVFVDSWEKAEDKHKNAADFIAGKGYTFNVLLDLDDKVINSFGVTGIPTKYILDRNGKIRFKTIGFEGSDDGLMEEMKLMVEAVKGQP